MNARLGLWGSWGLWGNWAREARVGNLWIARGMGLGDGGSGPQMQSRFPVRETCHSLSDRVSVAFNSIGSGVLNFAREQRKES